MLLKRVSLRSRSAESSPWVCLTWLASAQCVDLVFGLVFHRGMAWKREARARLEKRRTEILGPCGEARGRPQGDRCDLNSSERKAPRHQNRPYFRTAGTTPGCGEILQDLTRVYDRVSRRRYCVLGPQTAYPSIRSENPRIRVSDPKTVISRQKPHREGDFQSPPGLELDCPVRNPCRATHSSSGVERLPWE